MYIHRCIPSQYEGMLVVCLLGSRLYNNNDNSQIVVKRIRFTCESFPIHFRVVFSVLWIILNATNKVSGFLRSLSFFSNVTLLFSFSRFLLTLFDRSFTFSLFYQWLHSCTIRTDTKSHFATNQVCKCKCVCVCTFWIVGCGHEYILNRTLLETSKSFYTTKMWTMNWSVEFEVADSASFHRVMRARSTVQ